MRWIIWMLLIRELTGEYSRVVVGGPMTVAVTQRTSPEMKYLELFKNMACSGILTVANN